MNEASGHAETVYLMLWEHAGDSQHFRVFRPNGSVATFVLGSALGSSFPFMLLGNDRAFATTRKRFLITQALAETIERSWPSASRGAG